MASWVDNTWNDITIDEPIFFKSEPRTPLQAKQLQHKRQSKN